MAIRRAGLERRSTRSACGASQMSAAGQAVLEIHIEDPYW